MTVAWCCSVVEGSALLDVRKRPQMPYDALQKQSFAVQLCKVSATMNSSCPVVRQSILTSTSMQSCVAIPSQCHTTTTVACMSARWPGWMASQTTCCALRTATAPACASQSQMNCGAGQSLYYAKQTSYMVLCSATGHLTGVAEACCLHMAQWTIHTRRRCLLPFDWMCCQGA